jgi:hypothetical protein
MDQKFLQELGEPIPAKEMVVLKQKKKEKERLSILKRILKLIYDATVNYGEKSIGTRYVYKAIVPFCHHNEFYNHNETFIKDNLNDIMAGLKHLFPYCYIQYKLYSSNSKGNMHDITDLEDVHKMLVHCLSDGTCLESRFIIDWTESE